MEFTFEVAGEKLIARRLERFADRVTDASPAFRQIADDMRGMEARLFETSGASGGETWKALADSTKKTKRAKGSKTPDKPLQDTGALRTALTQQGGAHQVEIVGPTFLVFGTDLDYSVFHQRGRGVPRRRPQQFTEAQKQSILKTLQAFIVTGETPSGGGGGSHGGGPSAPSAKGHVRPSREAAAREAFQGRTGREGYAEFHGAIESAGKRVGYAETPRRKKKP